MKVKFEEGKRCEVDVVTGNTEKAEVLNNSFARHLRAQKVIGIVSID